MDYQLERWINAGAGNAPPLDWLMRGVAAGAELAFIALVAAWLVIGVAHRHPIEGIGAIMALLSAGLALLANQLTSHLWYRARPFVDHPRTVHVLLSHSRDASFPSDHAAAAFAIGVVLVTLHRRLGITALVVAALVAYARVYVGDHYPADVLAGAMVGLVSATTVLLLWRGLAPSRLSVAALRPRARRSGSPPATQLPGQEGR